MLRSCLPSIALFLCWRLLTGSSSGHMTETCILWISYRGEGLYFPTIPPLHGSIHTLSGGHLQVLYSTAGGVLPGDPHKVANVCWLQGGALGV
jgi:hypothetical protein